MHTTDVLISGAGIAGSAAAFWLARAGFSVTVVERAPAPRPGGQAVDLRGAGRTVVERMGLLDRAREIATDQHGLELVGDDGRSLFRLPVDSFGGEGIISEIEILRGDLATMLHDAVPAGTDYIFDDTITALDADDDGVTVRLEKSAAIRCRLVIGADGSHSVVRNLILGGDAGVRPMNCYTSWFSSDAAIDGHGWVQMHNAPGGRVAMVRPGTSPGDLKVGLSFRSTPFDYDRRDLHAQQDILSRRFAGVGWEVPRLLDAMRSADDFFFDSMDQIHLDHWHQGRVVLLGDAGYCASPLTGLGTSLALVGSYVLAGELSAAGADHATAFARYEQIMRPYVSQAQTLPPGGAGGFAPSSRFMIKLRTASMRASLRWPLNRMMARQFAKADAIELPDYTLHADPVGRR
ncbi:FAD-dependent oxidoreductase [Microlunatus soli]|uniref:2-polyprenyl-6-methoxyphenol hydroxylase n=1 Tax=Microlunatus soli TaxID=630515 RepID=A0A1H1U7X5_9ACTN|nr:FAD-dependent oxidoreductase [Microlunatus soli]SDS68675.1 2-polyprenyl-6-methoxyphenol hydroxylase [Microlunatus soli]